MANKLVARKKIATYIIRENSLVKKKRSIKRVVILVIIICMLIAATILLILHFVLNGNSGYPIDIGIYSYEIINKYDHVHDPIIGQQANVDSIVHQRYISNYPFTQGLLYLDGNTLIESSGLYAVSYLRKFKLNTGDTERYYNLTNNYFAEGIALVIEPETYRKFIFVLTYKENTILAFDYNTFELYNTFEHDLNGYGLTSNLDPIHSVEDLKNGKFANYQKLWTTSGNEFLYELEIPHNFKKTNKISIINKRKVTCAGFTIKHINELEYHLQEKTIYANIFMTNLVIEIDISKGTCLKIINLSGLIDQSTNKQNMERNRESFLNGIAINPVNNKESIPNLLVTGKFWPNLFEIKLVKTNGLNPNSVLIEYFKTIRHRH
ncbi:glutaminyl-peptide cyclotransferase, putative [Plasmodium berghei]|uniref:Glutaminyl-peptide cyclotransferase, putative n=2 Tax=Plasmodium berghei TaxID=5821 RepID=A0A509APJ6_PLABA|nr:glutaminyl-peptide cyclotransferase, putative [Plasmodium berghei ANKA]CXI90183.1 glutaminyl-peptide cyclotransferase, putative [Plasmodium berghei]SCL96201.1 glutaminyl-peptide cyclotransferase, putative [Plasmodium berghei]SCM16382.1 glutaminyl-peptide cyclotransferase, putative [Plasmodium berghei]SCM18176.1 glutaminyl-peptide cyclotransferase, putative [Plasmodium berghei]SCN27603.1 glutaminyl-peptide cyclotransferase, putative [Plasmodium berghei]|eukprot:XP_034423259.1 glutaminyl-peptide cyclotransferase, putative [Plasmodium berghei ANKA]